MAQILIIDDDSAIRKLFSQFLEAQGHVVSLAENGKAGMRMIEENQPDLIITDILMPEMDGLEILMEIRSTCAAVPVIAISGGMRNMPINFLQQAKLFGARYVFEKPVPLNPLLSAVNEVLDSAD